MSPLVLSKRAPFEQDRIGHADLADVVKQRAVFERDQIAAGHPELLPQANAVGHNSIRMAPGLDIARLEGCCKRSERGPVVEVELLERRVQAIVGEAQLSSPHADQLLEVLFVLLIRLEQRTMS